MASARSFQSLITMGRGSVSDDHHRDALVLEVLDHGELVGRQVRLFLGPRGGVGVGRLADRDHRQLRRRAGVLVDVDAGAGARSRLDGVQHGPASRSPGGSSWTRCSRRRRRWPAARRPRCCRRRRADRQDAVVLEQVSGLARGLVGQRRVRRLVEAVRAVDRVAVRVVEDAELELEPRIRRTASSIRASGTVARSRDGEAGRARVGAAHHVGPGVRRADPGARRQPVGGDQTGVAEVLPQVGEDLGAVARTGTARVEVRAARVPGMMLTAPASIAARNGIMWYLIVTRVVRRSAPHRRRPRRASA